MVNDDPRDIIARELRMHGTDASRAANLADCIARRLIRDGVHLLATPAWSPWRRGAPFEPYAIDLSTRLDDQLAKYTVAIHPEMLHRDRGIVLPELSRRARIELGIDLITKLDVPDMPNKP